MTAPLPLVRTVRALCPPQQSPWRLLPEDQAAILAAIAQHPDGASSPQAQASLDEAVDEFVTNPRLMLAVLERGAQVTDQLRQVLYYYSDWSFDDMQDADLMTAIFRQALRQGADPNVIRRRTELLGMSVLGDVLGTDAPWTQDVARLLVEAGAQVNGLPGTVVPLAAALQAGTPWPVLFLLEQGADASLITDAQWEDADPENRQTAQAWLASQRLAAAVPDPTPRPPRLRF